jgi:hypothetical protein
VRLAIVVPVQSEVAGLQVTRDGAAVGRGSWGSGIAVDPGEHVVAASAPGRASWNAKVSVARAGTTETVTVPPLEVPSAAPSAPSARAAPAASIPSAATTPSAGPSASSNATSSPSATVSPAERNPSYWGGTRIAGLGAIGLGAVGLVIGTVYGLKRNSKQDEAKAQCTDYPHGCNDAGQSANDDAASAGKVAVGAFVVGGALVAAGVVLLLIPQSSPATQEKASRTRIVPLAEARGGGLLLQGTW